MKILATHPGRHGDCLWAMATVQAIARSYHTRVDLLLSPAYGPESFSALLAHQPYVGEVRVAEDWALSESAPITPRIPPTVPGGYDEVVHLGYERWPEPDVARATYANAARQLPRLAPLDLSKPWMGPTVAPVVPRSVPLITVGWSDEHFELKYGLYQLLRTTYVHGGGTLATRLLVNVSGGPRWVAAQTPPKDWLHAATWIANAHVFVGCCSGLHVLAVALGVPVIVVEPNPHRHHPCFYPLGTRGQVAVLLGGDGQPTVDSRHLIEAIEQRLVETSEGVT